MQLHTQECPRPPAFVGTFHRLALDWGAPTGSGDHYFETVVLTGLRDAASARPDRFDAVVVDEAQDFGEL